jgi:hypothetical protein
MNVFKRFWHIPNTMLESGGRYFGRVDKPVQVVFRVRSLLAVGILLLVPFLYPAYARGLLPILDDPRTQDGYTAFNVFATLLFGLIFSATGIIAFLVLFSTLLFVVTKRRARRAMLQQLRWTLISLGFLLLWFGGTTLVIDLAGPPWEAAIARSPEIVRITWIGLKYAVGAVVELWTLKVIYLAAGDVCRADDGHPVLAPLVTTAAAWAVAVIATVSLGVATGVPHTLALGLAWGGPIIITGINVWACVRIHRHHRDLLFRDGPPAVRSLSVDWVGRTT